MLEASTERRKNPCTQFGGKNPCRTQVYWGEESSRVEDTPAISVLQNHHAIIPPGGGAVKQEIKLQTRHFLQKMCFSDPLTDNSI